MAYRKSSRRLSKGSARSAGKRLKTRFVKTKRKAARRGSSRSQTVKIVVEHVQSRDMSGMRDLGQQVSPVNVRRAKL